MRSELLPDVRERFEKGGGGVSEPLIAELEKCIANMERDINECDKIYIHISNAKALVDQLNSTQPSDDEEPVKVCKYMESALWCRIYDCQCDEVCREEKEQRISNESIK